MHKVAKVDEFGYLELGELITDRPGSPFGARDDEKRHIANDIGFISVKFDGALLASGFRHMHFSPI
jgi:hypothetical protein